MTNPLLKMMPALTLGLALALMCGLVGCDGSDSGDPATDAGRGEGVEPHATGEGDDTGDAPDTEQGGVLVGTWDAVSDQNSDLPPGTLVFTYRADGTGAVVEEGGNPKTYAWVHDVDAGTLHVLTENEDMLFDATLAGDTLTLVMEEPAMRLVMRRTDGAGE